MKKYELLKQLQEEQLIDKATVEQICADWNWTVNYNESNHTTTNVNININKGKIIEITKEVEVPVTDDTEINKLKAIIEQLTKEKEELKEELFSKELLLNEFRETTDELIKENHVYKGMVAGYEAQLQNKDLTIESLEREIADIEEQKYKMEGRLTGEINTLKAELEREKANVKTVYVEIETEHFEEEPVEETKVAPQTNTRKIEMDLTIYDLHRTNDGCYRGYTKDYEFVWDTIKNVPAMKLNGGKVWRPMIKEYYQQAQYLKQQILEFKDSVDNKHQDKPATKTTKETDEQEIVVNVTKENHVKPGDTVVVKASDIFGSEDTNDNDDELGNTDEMEFF